MCKNYISSEEVARECLKLSREELKMLKKRDIICKIASPLVFSGALTLMALHKCEMGIVCGLVATSFAIESFCLHFEKKETKEEISSLEKRIEKFEKSNETRKQVVEYYKQKQQAEKEK